MSSTTIQILSWLVVWFLASIPLGVLLGWLLRVAREGQAHPLDETGSIDWAQRRGLIAAADPASDLRRARRRRGIAVRAELKRARMRTLTRRRA